MLLTAFYNRSFFIYKRKVNYEMDKR